MDNKKIVELSDDSLDLVQGGVKIVNNTVTNKDTGETYKLLTDPMTAFTYMTMHGAESDTEIINGMLAMGYIA